ncbi:hypothetical protein AB1Y20_019278 [Prymnesium parvum]|uniref:Uncharacterized protein n=1 Tax=Prymnesium parvum TaxID=97485 RepID=A0AB34JTK1_PRYPA
MSEDGSAVHAYLRRFQVEEVVQAAVNSAIVHKAANPILHIADFLEELGRKYESTAPAPAASDYEAS